MSSQEALEHIRGSGIEDSQLLRVEGLLLSAKERGATADEIRHIIAPEWPGLHNGIVSSRLARLAKLRTAAKTARSRKASTGRMQGVYIHSDYADPADMAPMGEDAPKDEFLRKAEPILRALKIALDRGQNASVGPNGPLHNLLREKFK